MRKFFRVDLLYRSYKAGWCSIWAIIYFGAIALTLKSALYVAVFSAVIWLLIIGFKTGGWGKISKALFSSIGYVIL